MSLRRRLFVLLFVSFAAVAATVGGMAELLGVPGYGREADASARARIAALAVTRALRDGAAPGSTAPLLDELARTFDNGAVGVCLTDGRIVAERSVGRPAGAEHGRDYGPATEPRFGPPAELRFFDRERVADACRAAASEPTSTRVLAPSDVLFLATQRVGLDTVSFAMIRVRPFITSGATPGLALLAGAGLLTLALLGLTAHSAWVLRSSTNSLRRSVGALERDLRAEVPTPRAEELADVARHLRGLAANLADAQDREHVLLRDAEEQRRLAGLGRVVAGVAHEVRNPLAGMKLRLDSIALRSVDARTRMDVVKCLGEVARLDRLVRAMLLASHKRAIERVPTDLAVLLEERIALLGPLVGAKQVRIEHDAAGEASVEGESVAGALDNLLRNAVDASTAGGLIEVHVVRDPECLRVDVVDAGPGVPHHRVGELFEPFFTTKANGTGLGLLLARATAEAHGGTLEYERRDGRTMFSMRLPS